MYTKASDIVKLIILVNLVFVLPLFAQKTKAATATSAPVIFAVLNDGKELEPIAYVKSGKLEPTANGMDDSKVLQAFNKAQYKPGTVYRLIFGGADSGSVSVKSSDYKADCGKNIGQVVLSASNAKLAGFVMGLATNAPLKTGVKSYRRRPSPAEKDEIDKLVRDVFTAKKLTPEILRYHNFTALDLNGDGVAEFVGSYWVEIDKQTRGLLFFIAEKGKDGKYSFEYEDYRSVDEASVMSGEIGDLDKGIYNELLLDVFDYNGDGISEVFTYTQSFEGAGFNVYKKIDGHWVKSFTSSNYHCAY